MEYMDVKTVAECWQLTDRRVTALCRSGRIEGAKKEGGVWLIPVDAKKPQDGRSTKSLRLGERKSNKPLPIGVTNYRELVENYYYVDKTLMIKEFIDSRPKVSLYTRPRRFGKTLTMDMIKTYFEISDGDTARYFRDKKIWSCGEKYQKEQGIYPVISVSFKDVKCENWEQAYDFIYKILRNEVERHSKLLTSDQISFYEKAYLTKILEGNASVNDTMLVFLNLSRMLHTHYGKAPIIIIDEYDTPIQQGRLRGYYDKVIEFMRTLFSGGFKDNSHLSYGFLTGILRVAKESIFSGLNNLTIHSILDSKYGEYFGFTADDVREMTEYYGVSEKFTEICEWYDGYKFGNRDISNPWSVINYFYNECFPRAYWQSTGDNSIIRQIVADADEETAESLRKLMQGEIISSYVDTSVIYPEVKNNQTNIYSFLLASGYLKVVGKEELHDGNSICEIAIPNKEIFFVYEREILSALSNRFSQLTAVEIQRAIVKQDIPRLQEELQKMLLTTISSFDHAHENFYHGLILGICAIMNNLYRVDSNRESGHGRYDIQLEPYNRNLPGVIIELKIVKGSVSEDNIERELEKAAQVALEQIREKQYVSEMKKNGITKFFMIGISFYKKYVRLVSSYK